MTIQSSRLDVQDTTSYKLFFLAALFFAVSNFMLLGVYMLLTISVVFILTKGGMKFPICTETVLLLLFSLTYFFTVIMHGQTLLSAAKIFVCPLIWGVSYMACRHKDIAQIKRLFLALGFGMAVHGVINFIYNSYLGTNWQSGLSFDFWSQAYSPSTGQAVNFTLFIALAVWLIFLQKESKLLTILGIVFLLISTIYDISIGGRTFLLLMGLAFAVSVLMFFVYSFLDTSYRRRVIPLLILIILLVVIGITLYQKNILGIKNVYEESFLYKRMTYYNGDDLVGNDRFDKKLGYVTNASKYLFGGNYLSQNEGFGYAHELWLDIYDDAGLVPYILIVVYTFVSGFNFVKIARSSDVDHNWRIALITMLLVVMLQFFAEPILSGSPMLLYSYIIMDGALARWLCDKKTISDPSVARGGMRYR